MKGYLLILITLITFIFISCSKDNNENTKDNIKVINEDKNSIQGVYKGALSAYDQYTNAKLSKSTYEFEVIKQDNKKIFIICLKGEYIFETFYANIITREGYKETYEIPEQVIKNGDLYVVIKGVNCIFSENNKSLILYVKRYGNVRPIYFNFVGSKL